MGIVQVFPAHAGMNRHGTQARGRQGGVPRACGDEPTQPKSSATCPPRRRAAAEEWLLIEWPEGEAEPDHYWLSTLPADISLECMVEQAKLRWRIERDYLELKQEVGLGHQEGRGWRGFHHHATLCVAAYGFLISEKETIPPSGHPCTWRGPQSSLPISYRPRGSAAAFATPHAELNRNIAYPPRADFGARSAAMSLLRTDASAVGQAE